MVEFRWISVSNRNVFYVWNDVTNVGRWFFLSSTFFVSLSLSLPMETSFKVLSVVLCDFNGFSHFGQCTCDSPTIAIFNRKKNSFPLFNVHFVHFCNYDHIKRCTRSKFVGTWNGFGLCETKGIWSWCSLFWWWPFSWSKCKIRLVSMPMSVALNSNEYFGQRKQNARADTTDTSAGRWCGKMQCS